MADKSPETWDRWRGRPLARPLVPVTLALMLGIASPAWGLRLPGLWVFAGLAVFWLDMALDWVRRRPLRLLPLAFFWLLGVAFCQQAMGPLFPVSHITHLSQDQEFTLLGHLQRPSKLGPRRIQLFLRVEARDTPEGWRPARGRLLVLAPSLEPPPVGTGVVVRGRLRSPLVLKNPGAFDRARYLAADGIFREIRLRHRHDLVFLATPRVTPLGEKLRGGIRVLLKKLDPATGAIYLAMLLGDQGEITPQMRRAFSRTGTSHLLVINGLHLSMVAAVVYFLSFLLLRRSVWLLLRLNVVKVATLLAAASVAAYAWVAGGSPSTQRAEIMVLAYLLLVFLGRPREIWSALALAALAILTLAPLRLFSISFQLSFAAVAALIYLVPRLLPVAGASAGADYSPGLGPRLWFLGKEWLVVSVVAALATAPLVAAYFQVVSLLGVLVNLVTIPLVLGLALPLGEAAVLAQALSLTPVAQGLLALGRLPLWLGYEAIALVARLPGSAFIVPTPTWLQIVAYYLILILGLAPRRNFYTWSGTALAGAVLAASLILPGFRTPQVLEVTCLDSFRGLTGVAVTPEGQRLVFSASGPSWPGRQAAGRGPLPAYCHWRQFRRLDMAMALSLSRDNALELLTLHRQFHLGPLWYGRRGRPGEASWDLWNTLGDEGRPPRSLKRGKFPGSLGSVRIKILKLSRDNGTGLELTYEGRKVVIIPPLRQAEAQDLEVAPETGVAVLILPQKLPEPGRARLLTRLHPQRLVVYGGSGRLTPAAGESSDIPCHLTREGTVSVYLDADRVTVRQWRPLSLGGGSETLPK